MEFIVFISYFHRNARVVKSGTMITATGHGKKGVIAEKGKKNARRVADATGFISFGVSHHLFANAVSSFFLSSSCVVKVIVKKEENVYIAYETVTKLKICTIHVYRIRVYTIGTRWKIKR